MRFSETVLGGAYVVELERLEDERGFFARTFCAEEFAAAGLEPAVVQCNTSWNRSAGTLRGIHFQVEPGAETKLVRCTRGAIVDVIVDLRPGSPTHLEHVAIELSAANGRALYVPRLFGHAYQTLVEDTEVAYQVSSAYAPGLERGLRYDDPRLGIEWPIPVSSISSKDASWPLLEESPIVEVR